MREPGFFDMQYRMEKLSEEGDRLEELTKLIEWEMFRAPLDQALNRTEPKGGRPPFDSILMFKIIVLQSLYNTSDEQTQFLILDRLSFMRFLGLGLESRIPDARTIWHFRESLKQAGVLKTLFDTFEGALKRQGFESKKGQIVDACFVEVPRQRNTRAENSHIKETKTAPSQWSKKKKAHKDVEARWTKKNGEKYYGYKNHVTIDREHKLIRAYTVSDASVHDSQRLEEILLEQEKDVWADSAYRSDEQEDRLHAKGYASQVHERAYRNKPLSEEQKKANTEKSRVRARVEHVFAHMTMAMGGLFVRTIGIARARIKIDLKNLSYNFSRYCILKRRQEKCA